MHIQKKIVLSFAIALAITSAASAQRRAGPAKPAEAGVAIALQVAGQPYQFGDNAVCQHEPAAYIYNVAAGMWMVHQNDSGHSMMLTLWRPKNRSGDMFSLSVDVGGKSYAVNTVNLGAQSAVRGSGKVTLTPSGTGGTFSINATAANGAAITGTITCRGFAGIVAEGG